MNIRGVDISNFQRDSSIKNIIDDKYEFAILRGGYTGYGVGRTMQKDSSFEKFYYEAKELGFPVGAYWYSCADSAEEGEREAKFFYENCLKGKQFEYPIYIDVEEPRWQLNKKEDVTKAIIAFCKYLEERGYFVGVYASLSWFNNYIDTSKLNNYTKWVAYWSNEKPKFQWTGFHMWQYSEKEEIQGVKFDGNVSFVDFPPVMKHNGLNGFTEENKDLETFKVENKKLKADLENITSQYDALKNTLKNIVSKF